MFISTLLKDTCCRFLNGMMRAQLVNKTCLLLFDLKAAWKAISNFEVRFIFSLTSKIKLKVKGRDTLYRVFFMKYSG